MAANKAIYDTSMKRAHEYAWANQWDRAAKEYDRALTEFPEDRAAQRNMAQCLFRLRQWPQALAAYESLISAEPGDLFAINRLAEIYLALGQQEPALATYTRLADLYTQSNQFHEAIRALRDLSRALPMNKEVHGRLLELSHEVGDRSAQAVEHLALSGIYLADGDTREAQEHADAAASLDAENPDVKRWVYTMRKRLAEAAGTLPLPDDHGATGRMPVMSSTTEALSPSYNAGEPQSDAGLIARAVEAQNKGEFRVALDLYEKAMQAGSTRSLVFYNAGLLNQQLNRPELAIAYFQRSLQDPEFAMTSSFALGQCYHSMGDAPRAVAAFERALGLINVQQLSQNEADELIELYTATATAHLADNNPGRAASLYAALVTTFKERRWSHPQLPELERKADELYHKSIQSKLLGISRGSAALDPDQVLAPKTQIITGPQQGTHSVEAGGTSSLQTQIGTGALLSSATAGLEAGQTSTLPGSTTPAIRPLGRGLRTITEFLRTSQAPGSGPMHAEAASPAEAESTMRLVSEASVEGMPFAQSISNPHNLTNMSNMMMLGAQQQSMAVQLMIAEGEQAMSQGMWDPAIDSCLAVIYMEPDYLPVHMMLGDIYLHQNKVEEAVTKYQTVMDTYIARRDPESAADVCRRLLQLQPENPALHSRLGVLLLEAGRVDEAAKFLLAVADRHFQAGAVQNALQEAENLKVSMPNSSDVALAIGTYHMALGDPKEALTELSRALRLDPSNDVALARLYVVLTARGETAQWDALQSMLERATKSGATSHLFMQELHNAAQERPTPALYYGTAVLAARTAMPEIAASALDQGLLLTSMGETRDLNTGRLVEALMCQLRADLARSANDGAVAAQHYERVLSSLGPGIETPDPPVAADAPVGGQSHATQALQSPRPQYSFVQLAEPTDLYLGLAEAHASQNNWEGALQALRTLKQLMPGDHSIYTRMADIYFRQGQLSQALSELNELLVLFQKANDNEKTLETLGHMAKLAPNNIAVRRKLSDMYIKLGMTEYGLGEMNTLAELQLKAGLLKDAMLTYQKAADLHYMLGQHNKAIGIYERIVRIAPRDIDARHQLINMYIQSGKIADAVSSERALAEVFVQEGHTEEAIAALHQLLALAPEDVPAHHMLAKQLTALGEYGQAARLYGRLLRLDPDNDRVPILQSEMQRMAREASQDSGDDSLKGAATAQSRAGNKKASRVSAAAVRNS